MINDNHLRSAYKGVYRYCHTCGTATPWDYGDCYKCTVRRREKTRSWIIVFTCIGVFGFVIWRIWTGI